LFYKFKRYKIKKYNRGIKKNRELGEKPADAAMDA